jgi:glutamate synthase (NADPH/NADH) small chain
MTDQPITIYNELVPGLGVKEAITEAKRCLNCKKPGCKTGCPIENNIPEFIHQIARGNIGEAHSLITEKSNLPAVCGRVCAHELQCEGHCVLAKQGQGIRVGQLERFAADFSFRMGLVMDKIQPKSRGQIAVIGSGPAGLTIAGDLARIGFLVTVYEAQPEAGGVLMYGIPAYRLPKEVVRREIYHIETLGVSFQTNRMVGPDFTVDDLFARGHDAVFIGSGTALAKELDLPGKELAGIIQSIYFLYMNALFVDKQIERKDVPLREGDRILVIGSGNVAMDAARSALRFGAASATIVARESRENMTALKSEYEGAAAEGVQFEWETSPARFVGSGGKITGLAVTTAQGERELPADKVFLAIGARPANRIVSTTKGIDVDKNGYVITKDRPYGMTTRKGVFAGGDVVHRPATVVLAMKEAQKVAEGIAAYVDAIKLLGISTQETGV